MGRALELISGRVTAPGAVLTALTMNGSDSATVRALKPDGKGMLLQMWGRNQVAGIARVRSPKLHDVAQGIRNRIVAAAPRPLIPWGSFQRLYGQDTLTLELSGSGVAGQIEHLCMLIYYDGIDGLDSRLATSDQARKAMQNLLSQEVAGVIVATGDYGTPVAINATFDNFKANTDYALLGYEVDAQCSAVTVRGADTGNVRVGGPGDQTLRHLTARWFVYLSDMYGMALVPILNSANKSGIFVEVLQDQAAGAVNVTLHLAEIGPTTGSAPGR